MVTLKCGFRGHSRSLKRVSYESLGTVSYSPSTVTMAVSVAVCELFSVKECRKLKTRLHNQTTCWHFATG